MKIRIENFNNVYFDGVRIGTMLDAMRDKRMTLTHAKECTRHFVNLHTEHRESKVPELNARIDELQAEVVELRSNCNAQSSLIEQMGGLDVIRRQQLEESKRNLQQQLVEIEEQLNVTLNV